MSGDPSKTSGKWESTKGGMKETLGSMTGSTSLKQSGQEQQKMGEAEYNQARAQGYAEGTGERLAGTKDSITGSMTGNQTKQAQGDLRKEKGSTQQDVNRSL